jgi:hypothetical protein
MPTCSRASAAVVLCLWVAFASGVRAQQTPSQDKSSMDEGYFAAKLMLGFAGTVGATNNNVAGANVSASSSDKLRPTFGGGAQYMHPLHRYFVLGGLFAGHSWQNRNGGNAGTSRNTMLDLAIVPEGRLPITREVELYLALPVGVSLDFWNGPKAYFAAAGLVNIDVSADTAVGFNLGLLFGARFALSRAFGLLAEVGYTLHSFSHDINVQANVAGFSAGGSASVDLTLEQLAVNLGVYF